MRNLSLCSSVILEVANDLIELRPSEAVAVIGGRRFLPDGRINGLGREADHRTRVPQYTRVLCPADQVWGAPYFSKSGIWLEITPPFAAKGHWRDGPPMSEATSGRHLPSAIPY